jgi:peptide deformylase
MILPVYTYNHPVLKQKTTLVDDMSDELNSFIDDMFATMYNANGIGLAANQVGKGLALTVIDIQRSKDEEEAVAPEQLVLINPVIEAFSDEEEEFEEGCLSLPDFHDIVIRPSAIQVRYLDRAFNEHVRQVDGTLARVMQHEIDHLNGIYFFERLSPIRRTLANGKLKRIARGDIEPEYEIFRG